MRTFIIKGIQAIVACVLMLLMLPVYLLLSLADTALKMRSRSGYKRKWQQQLKQERKTIYNSSATGIA